ncbi:putative F-box/LRR-repeat protein 23, partial [Tanacetum coccineum]
HVGVVTPITLWNLPLALTTMKHKEAWNNLAIRSHHSISRSSALRYLKVTCKYEDEYQTIKGLTESLMKFPLLEELSLYMVRISKETIEIVGRHCPKLKTLKVNKRACKLCVGDANEESLTSYNEIAIAIGSVFLEKLMLPPLQSRWETSQPPPPLSAGIIVAAAVELLVLPEFVWQHWMSVNGLIDPVELSLKNKIEKASREQLSKL